MPMPIEQIIDDGCGCGPVYSEGQLPVGAIDGQVVEPVIEQTPEGFFEGASTEEGDGDQAPTNGENHELIIDGFQFTPASVPEPTHLVSTMLVGMLRRRRESIN